MAVPVTLQGAAAVFGVGTNVSAYPTDTAWQGGKLTGAPSGSAAAGPVAVASDGSLAFTGLTEGTRYTAYANVSGVDRYMSFVAPTTTVAGAKGPTDTELPAAVQIADGLALPSSPIQAAIVLVQQGASVVPLRSANVFKHFASTAITAGTGATIWTPAAGKKFRILGLAISSSAAGQLLFGDNVVGTVIARSPTLAAGGVWEPNPNEIGNGILSAAINNVLKIDGPTGNVAGWVCGVEE